MAPAEELVERFRAGLAALATDPQGPVGIAFSGGPDSLALLLLANAAFPGMVKAATVDHGLRRESAAEAHHAAEICAKLGVPHEILRVDVAQGNVQSQARTARYLHLSAWAANSRIGQLCTAHHRDDQVETVLMRLNRGSGLSGLAGIRASGLVPGSDIRLLRPLLGWSRTELANIVSASGMIAVEDPSNRDHRFDRVRIRGALTEADWIDADGVARSAQVLAQMEDSVLGLAREERRLAGQRDLDAITYFPMQRSTVHRPAIWGEIIVMICAELGRAIARSDAVRMAEELARGGALNMAGIQARSHDANGQTSWSFAPESPRRKS